MQGTQAFQADAKSEIDLESFVAEDHTLRKVDRVLDLAFVRKLTAPCYSQLGAPSIDPEVFFRMLLVAYHYGIKPSPQSSPRGSPGLRPTESTWTSHPRR